MPKMKTNRGAAKRFKTTGTGKVRRNRAYAGHLMTSKSPARRRRLRTNVLIHHADEKLVSAMLPYRNK